MEKIALDQEAFMAEARQLKTVFDGMSLEEWKYLFVIHKFGIDEITTKLNILNEEYEFLHDYNPIDHMESRVKSPTHTVEKLLRLGVAVTPDSARQHLHDIAGIRVICSFKEDVKVVFENLVKQSDITVLEVKDYISQPKANGYRSLHVLAEVPIFLTDKVERVIVEVQIRTVAMDFWASLEHKLYYKKNVAVPAHVVSELNECAQLAALLDDKMQRIKEQVEPYLGSANE